MTAPARHACAALFYAGLMLMLAATSFAQEGPIVVGQREKPPPFAFYDTTAYANFLWRQRYNKQNPNIGPTQNFYDNYFEETFTLNTLGHIVHPNLVDLNLSGTFGLTQEYTDDGTNGDTQNGLLYEYDLNATILRKEIAPLTLYARRAENQLNLEFGPTVDYTLSTYGAIWDIKSKTIPTRFEIFHSDQTQTGVGSDVGNLDLVQDNFLWHSEARPAPGQTITWDYTFSNVSENTPGFPNNDYLLNNANLNYSIDFGPAQRNNLTSAIFYYNQTGDAPIEQFSINELLRLRHTNDFETRYQYLFSYQDFSGVTQDLNRGLIGFTHRLYKSLVTSGNAGIEGITRSDGSDSIDYFADLTMDYHKKVPLGALNSFIGVAWNQQSNSDQVNPTTVINQPGTFVDSQPIEIIGNGIQTNSIRVTDPSGLITYRPGLDYTVDPVSGAVLLNRVVGGLIPPGGSVLLDYTLLPQSQNTVTTKTFFVGGRYSIDQSWFKGTSLYARYTNQNQDIQSDQPGGFTPNSFIDLTYGVEYNIWALTFGAEQEFHDATISPFDANRYFINYSQRFARGTTLNARTSYTQLLYTDDNNHVDVLLAGGSIQQQISRELYLSATLLWQDQEDDLNGPTRGFQEQLELNWTHRQTTFYGLIRNSNLDTSETSNSFQIYEVGMRRQF